ncbi:TetR/AcrR family transcriptional regulator [Fulvivirga sp. M361]|uniref:TetR/AcrR family transcriptional regulator n=1 Tax=Fulvivirga sp. M361 TaxID=2594266 RepID=UPI00117B964A|nr:TetR/AcrR family transcriptional regulator [Fulvivirga sp. M361]TRX58357.1 TetR/AcrR family transcriptional regulator [Fulvivirga sp. M361]
MSTKEKILDLAEFYIQHYGYNGFSYNDISTSLGVKNAAVHYHFPRKEELIQEVLRKARVQFDLLAREAETLDKTHLEKVRRFLKIYDNNLTRDNRVCLIGALATDLYTLPAGLGHHLNVLVVAMKSWLAEVLLQGKEQGEFDFDGTADQRAGVICSGMAGALQMARILNNDEYYKIKSQLLNDIIK